MATKEENLQKLYIEFQVLNNNIKQLEKQHSALENQLMELMVTHQSLNDMKKIKPKSEILVPLNSGIYAKAELKDNDKFIVNVGSNVTLSKDIDSTVKVIGDQIEEIKKLQQNLMEELQNSTIKAGLLEKEINKIASTIKEKE